MTNEPVSQREIDHRIQALMTLLDERFAAQRAAVDTATTALDIRLERMNEFRDQITTEREEYARKITVDVQVESLIREIRALQDSKVDMTFAVNELSKLEQKLHAEFSRDIAAVNSDISAIRATQGTFGKNVRALEDKGNVLQGRNLGVVGLVVGVVASVILNLLNLLWK